MRVLIADDHAIVRRGVKELLADEFSQVEFGEAANSAEAIHQIREHPWDVVVLDITMPGRSGLDVLRDVSDTCPGLPVLILSMHPEEQYAVRAFRAGAAGYLTKESAPEELALAVRTVLGGKRYVTASMSDRLAAMLHRGPEGPPHDILPDREYQVMRLIGSGKTVSGIAEELSLSVKTVSTYRARILQKLGMKTTAELIRYALKHGLAD